MTLETERITKRNTVDDILRSSQELNEQSTECDKGRIWGTLVELIRKDHEYYSQFDPQNQGTAHQRIDMESYKKILEIAKLTNYDPIDLLQYHIADRILKFRDIEVPLDEHTIQKIETIALFEDFSTIQSELKSLTPELYLKSLEIILGKYISKTTSDMSKELYIASNKGKDKKQLDNLFEKLSKKYKPLFKYIKEYISSFCEDYGLQRSNI